MYFSHENPEVTFYFKYIICSGVKEYPGGKWPWQRWNSRCPEQTNSAEVHSIEYWKLDLVQWSPAQLPTDVFHHSIHSFILYPHVKNHLLIEFNRPFPSLIPLFSLPFPPPPLDFYFFPQLISSILFVEYCLPFKVCSSWSVLPRFFRSKKTSRNRVILSPDIP